MQQPAYRDSLITADGSIANQYWWYNVDNNFTGSILPQWTFRNLTRTFRFEDLSNLTFCLSNSQITQIMLTNVVNPDNITYGKIYVVMHQYNKTTTTTRQVLIQGPFELAPNQSHIFNISEFNIGGLIRFVMINDSITDFGGTNGINNIVRSLVPVRITRSIRIQSI
jgi:hypothetical protein